MTSSNWYVWEIPNCSVYMLAHVYLHLKFHAMLIRVLTMAEMAAKFVYVTLSNDLMYPKVNHNF